MTATRFEPCPHNRLSLDDDQDLRTATDALRSQLRVARTEQGDYVLLRHSDVLAAALDDNTFSSQVSRFLQIPNGLDGAKHDAFRPIIDKYLSRDALLPFVPIFSHVAHQLMSALPKGQAVDAVNDIGAVFAVRAQCAWLGWPASLEPTLLNWMQQNHHASRVQDGEQMAQVAEDFDQIIRSVLNHSASQTGSPDNVTARLRQEQVYGRALHEAELVSILRNWTGGDLGSMALCVGVMVAYLIEHPTEQSRLATLSDAELDAAIDEILRIDDPFVSNRRVTRCPISIGEQQIPKGARVLLNWTSANRDERVFSENEFSPERHAANNLVYGAGKHVCPGRLLATWQLRIATQALLAHSQNISLAPAQALVRERPPLGGYAHVPVILR